jgi:hypothetical protein
MGKRSAPKQKIDVPLSINDSADIVTAQWNTFKLVNLFIYECSAANGLHYVGIRV